MAGEMNRNLMSFLCIAPRTIPPNTPLTGQSFVVTGGNRGFGRGVTLELVARGARVIIGARGTEAGTAVINEAATLYPDAPRVSYFPLDLTSFESIREFARKIKETLGSNGLSGLVNNAGLWSSEQKFTPAKSDQPEMEMTWAVNVFGLVYLTNQLQDLLLRSPPGGARIVNVASIAHLSVSKVDADDPMSKSRPFNFVHNYAESKLAVMFYTKQLAKRLGPKGVSVYAVDPGISQTEIGSNFGTVARWAMETVIARPFMRAPIDGSRSILFPLLFPSEKYHVNKWYFWYVLLCDPLDLLLN